MKHIQLLDRLANGKAAQPVGFLGDGGRAS
jgi:hypothetical protein